MSKTNQNYYGDTTDLSYVPLTPERERELFAQYYAKNSLEARDELIKCFLKLTVKVSLAIGRPANLPDDDTVSAGNRGLIQALEARKFDPAKGRFASYVRAFIRGKVLDAIRDRNWVFSNAQTTTGSSGAGRYSDEVTLTGSVGRTVTVVFEESPGQLTNGVHFNYSGAIRQAFSGDGEQEFTLETVDHQAEENQLNEVRRKAIEGVLLCLPDEEAEVVRKHYFEDKSLAQAGRELGISREWASVLHDRAKTKLAASLKPRKKELV